MANVYHLFRQRSKAGGDFILSRQQEPLLSYQQLDQASSDYAYQLRGAGVGRGDRVLVQVEKSPQCLVLYFACLRLGAVYLPLNTAYQDQELTYFVEDAKPALIVADPDRVTFFNRFSDTPLLTLDRAGKGSLNDFDPPAAPFNTVDVRDDEVAVIVYTSGTTGQPKGAMITHDNLATNALTLHQAWRWQADDVMLHALPLFHIHGLFVATHLAVLNASPIIFLTAFDPGQVLECLPQATVYMGVPTHYVRLLASGKIDRQVCRKMRLFTSGSAPLLAQTFAEFRERTGHEILERYGMTETGMNTSNPVSGPRKPGMVGLPLPGCTTRIVTADGSLAAPGTTGQLLVKGSNVFKGYWQLPEVTAAAFTAEGYFRTGDLARVDEDGYLAIVGRSKDMIISGGLNVYPVEIESEIDKLAGVIESAVIGLPHPDFGEGVCAIVVAGPDANLTEAQIIAQLKPRLANFKTPKWVHFVDALPRNALGKVQKNLLRERYTALMP